VEEKVTKTAELVNLLKKLYPGDQYAGVSGYLQGVMMTLENEYKSAPDIIQNFIDIVTEELNNK
jgi:hypothetical protein